MLRNNIKEQIYNNNNNNTYLLLDNIIYTFYFNTGLNYSRL